MPEYMRPIEVNLDTNMLVIEGSVVALQPQQAEIAYVLAGNWPGVTRISQLFAKVYGCRDGSVDVLRTQITRIRHILSPYGWTVKSHRGRGYSIERTHA